MDPSGMETDCLWFHKQTKALSWQDLNLELALEAAQGTSNQLGRLVAARPLYTFAIHASVKAAWNFIRTRTFFMTEDDDLEAYLFLFTFQSSHDKYGVLS